MAGWSELETDDKLERIKQHWRRGCTAKWLADQVGTTRASITGIYHRNRPALSAYPLGGRRSPVGAKPKPLPVAKAAPVAHRRPNAALQRAIKPPTLRNLPLEALGARDCKWPTTDEAPWLFCGCPADEGHSYCPYHRELSKSDYQKQKEQRTAA